jgi:iron complex outermembrane receptor protein
MNLDGLLLPALTGGLLALAATAHAQETPELPAAQGRSLSGPPAPAPVESVSGVELDLRGITSLEAIASAVPAITLIPSINSNNTPLLYMRAQGLMNPAQITRDGAVGVYQDGFYIARSEALTFDLLDPERIEVVPGPQGARYGRDTTGGVVNLISPAPAGKLRFKESTSFGNRNMFRTLASLDTPEWHGVSAKLTAIGSSIDGYVHNPEPGSNNYGEEHQRGGRVQLHWHGLPSFQADYSLERSDLESTPSYGTNPYLNGEFLYFPVPYYANPDGPTYTTYRPINLPLSTSNHVAHELTLNWLPSTAFTVQSLTAYRTLDANAQQDYAEFVGVAEATDDRYLHHQLSEEVKVAGSVLDREFSYAAGLSYFKERGWHASLYDFPTLPRDIEHRVLAETKASAAYLEMHWQPGILRRRFEVTLGGRYTKDVKDAQRFVVDSVLGNEENGAATGAVNHLSYRRFNPGGTLSYRWSDGISTYASASTGYRSGGALESAPVGKFGSSTFRPESLVTYELGLRAAFLGDRLRANLAAFTSTEHDVQYAIPIDLVTDEVYLLQKATIRGADLSLSAAPLRDLVLSVGAAYLRWTIDKAVVLAGTPLDPAVTSGSPYTVGESVTELFVLPYAPKYNFTAAGDYTFWRGYASDVSAHLDYSYRGQFYSDFAAGPAVPGRQLDATPAVGLLNARLQFATETDWSHHIKVALWGRNVLNRKYYVLAGGYGSGVSAFNGSGTGATPAGWLARAGAWAEPASYGINVGYEY